MATFKAVIYRHHKRSDGTYNVKIRLTHKRVRRHISTNIYVGKEDITKGLKIKNQTIIDSLDTVIKQYRGDCNMLGGRLDSMNIGQLVEYLKREKSAVFDLDFIKYGRNYVEKLIKNGKISNAKTYEIALNNLEKYVDKNTLSIHEVTSKFINDWIQWIKEQPARQNRKKGGRAESLYPSNIRALHNLAKKEFNEEELGIIRIPLSPFSKVSLPNLPERRERALDIIQIRKIFSLEDIAILNVGNNRFNFARDMFMLSFMLIGMNEADLYNCTEFENGRITYKRTKVMNRRKDKGRISIKIEPETMPLIEKYRDLTGERVFKFYKMYSSIETFTAAINGVYRKGAKGIIYPTGLKKIGDAIGVNDLEFYAARHSWASVAQNDLDIDKYTVHTALNHVIEEMKVTDIYTKKDWSPIDRANRKVLNYVFNIPEI
ncbi:MAG: site-specific integrase [Prevotellaceae bacterium]|jgi:integrase|nr:site-specific integrase [Prevotellaceae bacterium]